MLENEDLNVSEYEFLGQWHNKKNEILSENSSWVCKRMRPIRKLVNIKVVEITCTWVITTSHGPSLDFHNFDIDQFSYGFLELLVSVFVGPEGLERLHYSRKVDFSR